jgi:malate dehydrogenase
MKVAIVGAGMVGTATAHKIAEMGIGKVILVDIVEGLAEGKALDICHALAALGIDCDVEGSSDIRAVEGSDVVVVTSGRRREPGMSRMDLLYVNGCIVEEVCKAVAVHSPNSILIIVTNPLDVMCYVAWRSSGFPKERVIGQGGLLDSARFKWLISKATSAPVSQIEAMVIGEHGDGMLPLTRLATVSGKPLMQLLDEGTIWEIVKKTKEAGGELVRLMKTASAALAPGVAVALMVKAIANDSNEIIPASVLLNGEYGISGVFMSVPVRLCRDGVSEIVELNLTEDELSYLKRSAETVMAGMKAWEEMKSSKQS